MAHQRPSALRRQPVFDFRPHFCHSAPMEALAFGFGLRANAPEGQKRFPISETYCGETQLDDELMADRSS